MAYLNLFMLFFSVYAPKTFVIPSIFFFSVHITDLAKITEMVAILIHHYYKHAHSNRSEKGMSWELYSCRQHTNIQNNSNHFSHSQHNITLKCQQLQLN